MEKKEKEDKTIINEVEAVGADISVINEQSIKDKIYEIRGVKVMLDFELAKIYGYTTKRFNEQVKNNVEKFDEDFRFQLTIEEVDKISRSKKSTPMQTKGMKGGRTTLPWAFTESGIYMLMTVLKGELATKQSKALIRTFRAMKDYIIDNQPLIAQHDYLRLSMQVSDTQQEVKSIQMKMIDYDERLHSVFEQMQDTIKSSEISPFMLDFARPTDRHEYLILNGEPARADETYMQIYSQAKKSIYIVDNYINIKTLRLLKGARDGIDVIVFSDNLLSMLHASDNQDFQREFPNVNISYKRTEGIMHDRFIVLDFDTTDEKMYHCGASSKDAGDRMTAITEFRDEATKRAFQSVIQNMLGNRELRLR